MPLHLKLTTAGEVRKTAGTFFSENMYLAVGKLSTTTPWISIIDAPTFSAAETELESLMGMRKPVQVDYVVENEGTVEEFIISNITLPAYDQAYFRLISPTNEYCVWIDRSGLNLDPSASGQESIRVPIGITTSATINNLTTALNGLSDFNAVRSADTVVVTATEVGVCRKIEVSSGFTFTNLTLPNAGTDAGKILYSGKLWDVSATETPDLYLRYILDYGDIPSDIIYQFGLYREPTLGGGLPAGKQFLLPGDFSSLGELVAGVNSYPIQRSASKLVFISFIITF